MKKALRCISTLAVAAIFSTSGVSASGQHTEVQVLPANNVQSEGGEIVKAWRTTDKGNVELTQAQLSDLKARYKQHKQTHKLKEEQKAQIRDQISSQNQQTPPLKPSTSQSSAITPEGYYTITVYRESGHSWADEMWNERRRISDYVYNYTSNNATRTLAFKTSDTYTANVSLTVTDKNAINATIGSSWQKIYEISDSIGVTIPPNTKSWMDWVPIKDNTFGWLYSETYSDWSGLLISSEKYKWVDIYTPRQVAGGKDDGITMLKDKL